MFQILAEGASVERGEADLARSTTVYSKFMPGSHIKQADESGLYLQCFQSFPAAADSRACKFDEACSDCRMSGAHLWHFVKRPLVLAPSEAATLGCGSRNLEAIFLCTRPIAYVGSNVMNR